MEQQLTIRERILNSLQVGLQAYAWQGFEPQSIHLGRVTFDPDPRSPHYDQLPLLSIVPGIENSEHSAYSTNAITLPLAVSALISTAGGAVVDSTPGAAPAPAAAYTVGERALGAIHRAIYSENVLTAINNFGASVNYLGGGVASYPDTPTGRAVITVGVNLELKYETYIGNPYLNEHVLEDPEEGEGPGSDPEPDSE